MLNEHAWQNPLSLKFVCSFLASQKFLEFYPGNVVNQKEDVARLPTCCQVNGTSSSPPPPPQPMMLRSIQHVVKCTKPHGHLRAVVQLVCIFNFFLQKISPKKGPFGTVLRIIDHLDVRQSPEKKSWERKRGAQRGSHGNVIKRERYQIAYGLGWRFCFFSHSRCT